MRWPVQKLDLFLYIGLATEVIALVLIFAHTLPVSWLGSLLIVAGLILIGLYLFGRTLQIRNRQQRLSSDVLLSLAQGIIVITLALDEAALGADATLGAQFVPPDALRWAARVLLVVLIAAVLLGLFHQANGRPAGTPKP
jgi:uncharacterized integral membrane protein